MTTTPTDIAIIRAALDAAAARNDNVPLYQRFYTLEQCRVHDDAPRWLAELADRCEAAEAAAADWEETAGRISDRDSEKWGQLEDLRTQLAAAESRAATAEAERDGLAGIVDMIRANADAELTRRRNPGGLQAGLPRLAGVPPSVLRQFERDCRHALAMYAPRWRTELDGGKDD